MGAAASSAASWRSKWGWKVGDHFQLESFIPPYRVGKPFDFVVDGIYDTDDGASIPAPI